MEGFAQHSPAEAQRPPPGEPVTLSSAALKSLQAARGSKAAACRGHGGSKRAAPAAHAARARPASGHMPRRLRVRPATETPSPGPPSRPSPKRAPGLTWVKRAALLSRSL